MSSILILSNTTFILVTPLNWGLGHASRCIPIIKALKENGFTPVIASDGNSLELLKKEFPEDIFEVLPNYNIEYAKNGKDFKFKIIKQFPRLLLAIAREKKIISKLIKKYPIKGILSDNRFGVYHKSIPSIYITHQIQVLSGNTSWISTKLHQHFIKKFDQCWIPDVKEGLNLSGKLSHVENLPKNCRFIGPLTRFKKESYPVKNDLLIILSGPEPQRTLLEDKLLLELKDYKNPIVLVRGIVENQQVITKDGTLTTYNFMDSKELEKTIHESDKVICRSGYTTIMDLAFLEKKAFFIPTPGQFEQEYLAKKLKKEGSIPSCKQEKFTAEKLHNIDIYTGFRKIDFSKNWAELFSLFKRK